MRPSAAAQRGQPFLGILDKIELARTRPQPVPHFGESSYFGQFVVLMCGRYGGFGA